MAYKTWNVSYQHADGTPATAVLNGPQQTEAEVKAHYAAHFPQVKAVTAKDAAAPATPAAK